MLSLGNLTKILEALPDPAFVLTRSGRYVAVFGGSDTRYYHDGSGLVGKSIADVLNEEKANWFLKEIEQTLSERNLHIVEYELAGKDVKGLPDDGPMHVIWFEGRIQSLDFKVDGEDAVLWVASNITERHNLEEKLRAQSETDTLTGLWNRRYFYKMAAAEMGRAIRYNHSVSLLVFDVDHFKTINDTLGHNVGDVILSEIAQVVSNNTRESDVATRWGGEEFTILMPYATANIATEVAEKLRMTVAEYGFSNECQITISVGVAEWGGQAESIDSLLTRADRALYLAKHGGRNRVVLSAGAIAA